jgi:hypothetical protein
VPDQAYVTNPIEVGLDRFDGCCKNESKKEFGRKAVIWALMETPRPLQKRAFAFFF